MYSATLDCFYKLDICLNILFSASLLDMHYKFGIGSNVGCFEFGLSDMYSDAETLWKYFCKQMTLQVNFFLTSLARCL